MSEMKPPSGGFYSRPWLIHQQWLVMLTSLSQRLFLLQDSVLLKCLGACAWGDSLTRPL